MIRLINRDSFAFGKGKEKSPRHT